MKKTLTSAFIIAAIALNAQTGSLKKACIKMEKDENGKITKIDTCLTAATEEELQEKINALGFGDMPEIPAVPGNSAVPPVPPVPPAPPAPGKGKQTCTKTIVIDDEQDGDQKTSKGKKVKVISSTSSTGGEMMIVDENGNITRTNLGSRDTTISGSDGKVIIRHLKPGEKMDPEIEKYMYEYNTGDDKTDAKQIIIKNESNKDGKISNEVKVYVFSKLEVKNLSEADKKQLPSSANKAIQSAKPFDNLNVSPNPTEDACTISYKSTSNEPLQVRVYSMEGKTVLTETENTTGTEVNKSISLKELGKGIYFVHLTQGKQSEIKKVIVK